MTENREEKIILIKDIGIEKTTIDKVKIIKYLIIFIPLYFLTSCIFGLGDVGNMLSNN